MSSLFVGKLGTRSRYRDLTAASLNATTSASDALLLATVSQGSRMSFVDNGTNADMAILVVHPDADSSVASNRLLWFELPAGRVLNFDTTSGPSLEIDPGTIIYAYKVAGTASSGKLRILLWG